MAPIRLINVIRSTFVPTLRPTQRLVNVQEPVGVIEAGPGAF
jgi:hypothetical protein